MTDRGLEPLDDELDQLLAAERDRPDVPAATRARVLQRLATSLGPTGTTGHGGGPAASPATPAAISAAPAGVGIPVAVGLALGLVVASAIVLRAPDPPAPPPPIVTAPAATASATAAETARVEPPPIVDAGALPAPRPTSSVEAPPREDSLAAERALLDEAQRALASGRSAEALAGVARHAAEFPRGRLSEEREGLWIRALIAAGRNDEARARAERFKRNHPGSLLVPAIESALGTIP
jgi:hypothetical protein